MDTEEQDIVIMAQGVSKEILTLLGTNFQIFLSNDGPSLSTIIEIRDRNGNSASTSITNEEYINSRFDLMKYKINECIELLKTKCYTN